jgi:hypothetical protein
MVERNMRANGKMIKNMVMEYYMHEVMQNIVGNSKMAKNTEME